MALDAQDRVFVKISLICYTEKMFRTAMGVFKYQN